MAREFGWRLWLETLAGDFGWRLWEEGIHPPGRLRFFNDERFEAIKALWQGFCKRFGRKAEKADEIRVKKPVERGSVKESWSEKEEFKYKSSEYRKSREAEYWRWVRVYEYYKERSGDERYERQEQIALRIMERSRINPKLIKYIS